MCPPNKVRCFTGWRLLISLSLSVISLVGDTDRWVYSSLNGDPPPNTIRIVPPSSLTSWMLSHPPPSSEHTTTLSRSCAVSSRINSLTVILSFPSWPGKPNQDIQRMRYRAPLMLSLCFNNIYLAR